MTVWILTIVFLLSLLVLDVLMLHRRPHSVSFQEATKWSAFFAMIAALFGIVVYQVYENELIQSYEHLDGFDAVMAYFTGYLVELSLSVDNIFVIAVIFRYFQIPPQFQHRVLFWGILGAIVFRGIMIGVGAMLIHQFHWMNYVFGGLLFLAAYRMATAGDFEISPNKNPTIRLIKRIFPISRHFEGGQFFVRRKHMLAATPLFVALMIVETTDIMFAVDSIPAIFAITGDPYLVFSSNIFAILGLRSMYFLLASALDKFHYLKYSLVAILGFVGLKLILASWIHWPTWITLLTIVVLLTLGIVYSLWKSRSEQQHEEKKILETTDKNH